MSTATEQKQTTPQQQTQRQSPNQSVLGVVSDTMVLTGRYMRHITRQPEEIVTFVMIPVVMMLLFRYMLGGAIEPGDSSYVNFLIPGIFAIGVTLIAVSTTAGVFMDMQEGFVERLRSMSTLAISVVFAHVAAAVMRAVIAVTVLFGLGFAVGYRPEVNILKWIAAFALLLLFAFAVGWISALLGQLAKSTEAASGMALILVFLPYASNVFAPTETMGAGIRVFVEHQPITHVIDSVRALMLDQPVGNSVWLAVLWWGGITALCIWGSTRQFRRRFA